ncbi:MAG TPA: hypothetical protein VK927_02650, partial [Adhaeribacter sp.]|nr:hypothetical protein [Adhaeribacter sp.]
MTAYFQDDKIRRVNVNGNSESIYNALEGDSAVTGMNRAICSDMIILFNDSKLQSISFLDKPVARFIPPHELQPADTRIEGYQWLISEKPTREMVLGPRLPKKPAVKKGTTKKATAKKAKPTRKETRAAKKAQKEAPKPKPATKSK